LSPQFTNLANRNLLQKFGPEIWQAMDGNVDVFIAGAGTGGTFGNTLLKEKNPKLEPLLLNPKDQY
jgi:cysteine synthase